eukprot:350937-Chlamydomonas_euryale.AAC.1
MAWDGCAMEMPPCNRKGTRTGGWLWWGTPWRCRPPGPGRKWECGEVANTGWSERGARHRPWSMA